MEKDSINAKYFPKYECRWKTYSNYKLIMWAWMLNEISVVTSVVEISHSGYYIHMILHIISIIFIGIPIAYSEVCLAQYTNTGVISMWNFLPILRPVGYGTIYLVLLKTVYVMTLASWYLQYTFHAALDPPPWFTCDGFKNVKCMVKRINVSVFQHCLEAQMLFDDDCGVKTASNCFFEREIGNNTFSKSFYCIIPWKALIASTVIGLFLFIFSLRKRRFFLYAVKFLVFYVSAVVLVLLSVALSTSGAWYATKITIDWSKYDFDNCYRSIVWGFLSVGTGCGVIGFLSKDVSFRSPATMTSISTPLLSIFTTGMYSLIAFSGIKTMSYYHGEEENVIEMGISKFFLQYASISEILSYFDQTPIWALVWFSSIFLCILLNLWIMFVFLRNLVSDNIKITRNYPNLCHAISAIITCCCSWPLFCSDVAGAFSDAIEIIQLFSNLIFSVALYWIYGYKNHNIDIIFMIGVKASYFWKITWILSPILISSMLFTKWTTLESQEFEEHIYIESLGINHDLLIVYTLVGIYGIVIVIGILVQLFQYFRYSMIRHAFFPTEDWGPSDSILYKSRKMFLPEIMTREFLYRQVRIYGYSKEQNASLQNLSTEQQIGESPSIGTQWSAFTSN